MRAFPAQAPEGAFILVVPCLQQGRGGGHLSRSLALVSSLRKKGRDAFLWVPEADKEAAFRGIRNLAGRFDPLRIMSSLPRDAEKNLEFVVLDTFRTSAAEFNAWSALAPLVGIDEGGPCRDRFDFLLDLLPPPKGVSKANLCAPGLLPLPKKRRASFLPVPQGGDLRILVSFGAEDPGGLSFPAAGALAREFPSGITLVAPGGKQGASGPAEGEGRALPPGVRVLEALPDLKEGLSEYDLLITHFGLGAFEALYARVPVLLVSPTAYHERLRRRAGLPGAGKGLSACRRLGRLLSRPGYFQALCRSCEAAARRYGIEAKQKRALGDLLAEFFPTPRPNSGLRPALARFPERTYWRPEGRELIVMRRLTMPPVEYTTDYFFGLYKKQYGKTYLEDFPNLLAAGRRRLTHIGALLKTAPSPSLLDIGCAYGPFLAAAREGGCIPLGLEPSKDAARYVRETLGIPCIHGFFPYSLPLRVPPFDAVTLWYVIEHFEHPGDLLREIRRILKPGGVLAFSTPSYSGVSGRASLAAFLEKSPPDHWTVWSPRTCASYLRKHGFRVKKILVTGHHPERFPLIGPFLKGKGVLYTFFLRLSRLFRLGDTFEAYAVKE
jgi:SAM-dependent methyltransferase/spore coat polysaccharide biosynthesis predicted glycosyltransferase SpsG